nr:CRISPR-associated helicase Cas3' [Propionibacterium sp.]
MDDHAPSVVGAMTRASAGERLACLWAKSDAGGSPHSLIAHLLDAAAVGRLIWDRYLAESVRRQVSGAAAGRGRDLFVLLAAWHDLGKATPAFQGQPGAPEACRALVRGAGLEWPLAPSGSLPHQKASALIAKRLLASSGLEGWEWVLPILEGHHGRYGPRPAPPQQSLHGGPTWVAAQDELGRLVAERLGIDLDAQWVMEPPSRGVQLALGGYVVMADWIASSNLFAGLGFADQTAAAAQRRAEAAWGHLGLGSGWNRSSLMVRPEQFGERFGFVGRPLQTLVAEMAASDPMPGLLVIEAPMGEGKTEAALAAAEILGGRSGCSGLLFAMPTQGTTDAMYHRVREWMAGVDERVPVTLLHGKAILNEEWREALQRVTVTGVSDDAGDGYGIAGDEYGVGAGSVAPVATQWVSGRHRGLLAETAVCTVDQVLWAGTRTKYVALRHAGLAGHVLIIDEVHSYDVHMSVFLHEVLRWCARMEVPVVLMSATLPPDIRRDLVNAYRQGMRLPSTELPEPVGYPSVTVVSMQGACVVRACPQHRDDLAVQVRILTSADPTDVAPIVDALHEEVADGGCALVILNTVRRAQGTFRGLVDAGVESLLIHGRLTAAERARRTEVALDALGPHGRRPRRLVVVATQIAEQSFDVDADILYSDLAPMDLLLQRVGRLHRHGRDPETRPARLRSPRLVVTGIGLGDGLPGWPSSFARSPSRALADSSRRPRTVYRPYPLLATAAALRAEPTWRIPSAVPGLVADAYAQHWSEPESWRDAARQALMDEEAERVLRREMAATYRLDEDPSTERTSLLNLHRQSSADTETGHAVVRDGDGTLEVCLIRRTPDGFFTLGWRPLGANAERASDDQLAREVLGDSVRLRWRAELEHVGSLPQWRGHRLLGFMPVLTLDDQGEATVGRWHVRYDDELGLTEP